MKLHSQGIFFSFSTLFAFSCYGDNNLDAGYAKLLALSMTDDISVATLHSDGVRYHKYSLPYEFKDLYVNGDYFFSLPVRGNYLKIKAPRLHIDSQNSLKSRWDIFSFTLSPKLTYRINEKLSLENELGLGYANMQNKASFHGDGKMHEALRDEGLVDWNVNSFYVTPKIGLRNKNKLRNDNEINFYGRLSYLFIYGFKHEKKLNINSNTGTWSLGGEYVMNNVFNVNNRNVNLILANDIGGFYGKKHRELYFGFINSSSLAVEVPINLYHNELKVKTGIGYLMSDNAHGITVTMEIK